MDYISVRERAGVDYCKTFLDVAMRFVYVILHYCCTKVIMKLFYKKVE